MTRRSLLSALVAAVAGEIWVPGQKLISIPSVMRPHGARLKPVLDAAAFAVLDAVELKRYVDVVITRAIYEKTARTVREFGTALQYAVMVDNLCALRATERSALARIRR